MSFAVARSTYLLTNTSPAIGNTVFPVLGIFPLLLITPSRASTNCHFLLAALQMSLRHPWAKLPESFARGLTSANLPPAASSFATSRRIQSQTRTLASHAAPVTQDATGSKGPTAMVFLNMGGPSTTDEVGDFLSRLFVRATAHSVRGICANGCSLTAT